MEGKVALVTGGVMGIGLAIVKTLLKNGAKGVAIVDVSEESSSQVLDELNKEFRHSRTIFIKTDVSNKEQLEEAFEKTVQTYKQLDIVVNNAGIVNEAIWEETVSVNLVAVIRGSYLAMEKYLPQYKSGEEGVIVNMASVLGLNPIQMGPVYSATKHGVVSLGQSLGGEEYYNRYKVRVLTICPGLVKSALQSRFSPRNVDLCNKIREGKKEIISSLVQSPVYVEQAFIKAFSDGRSGSLWVTEDEEPAYEVIIPNRKDMRKS